MRCLCFQFISFSSFASRVFVRCRHSSISADVLDNKRNFGGRETGTTAIFVISSATLYFFSSFLRINFSTRPKHCVKNSFLRANTCMKGEIWAHLSIFFQDILQCSFEFQADYYTIYETEKFVLQTVVCGLKPNPKYILNCVFHSFSKFLIHFECANPTQLRLRNLPDLRA